MSLGIPMRRLLRGLFTVLATISLLLCVATVVLWVRSHRQGEIVMMLFDVQHTAGGMDDDGSVWGDVSQYRTLSAASCRGHLYLGLGLGGGPGRVQAGKVQYKLYDRDP